MKVASFSISGVALAENQTRASTLLVEDDRNAIGPFSTLRQGS